MRYSQSVIPLFKKDDQHILDNYLPISLLPVISKAFEKIVSISYTSSLPIMISSLRDNTVLEIYTLQNLHQ